MSNFSFVTDEWPAIHADCARAESYLTSDPRTARIYARRSAEGLVHHLYGLMGLPAPYKDDLAARTNDPGFKAKTGTAITQKLNLIRNLGNMHRVTAGCFADNIPSWRTMERIGMRREQHGIKDSWHAELGWIDGYTYAILQEEWESNEG